MTKRVLWTLALAALVLAVASSAPTKVPEPKIPFDPRTYVCYRAAGPVQVDGNLDEDVWSKAAWSDNFVDIEGSPRVKPRLRTMVKMLWDDQYFYIGAYLEEPNLWATLTERDSVIYQDNDFEVFIDPDGDTHNYYELEMNALNTIWDLFLVKPYRDGGPALKAWDIRGLKSAVKLEGTLNDPGDKDKAWFVELAIPWDVLIEAASPESRPSPGDQWRMDFSRVEYRLNVNKDGSYVKAADANSGRPLPEDNWVWSPTGLVNIHYPEMWGYVQFSGKVAGQGRDSFARKPQDAVKWALRRIYYAEWAARAEKGGFTADLNALGLKDKEVKVKGYAFPPMIQTTESLFEAAYKGEGGDVWRIREDGKVWKDK
jgi:hypothetical protein